MNKQSILVADSDPKNLQILKENLETAGFRVSTVTNGSQAWELIKKSSPTIVLSEVILPEVDGLQLLERIRNDEQVDHVPLIFLTNKRDLSDRVKSLKMGANDYLVKPLHVKEVIAHIKMVLARQERRHSPETNTYFKIVGTLEELSVFELIESFGVERKTGILTIANNKKQSGQIFFKDGCVINATQGDFRKEKAVFQMLPWKNGTFTMVFKEVNVPDEIAVSNLGLLLQGLKRMELREKYLQQIPANNIPFLPTSTFKGLLNKRKLTKELVKFISLFDGQRNTFDIIDNSSFDDLRTLELIVRLYKQGFIKPTSEVKAPVHAIPRPEPELPDARPLPRITPEERRPPKISRPPKIEKSPEEVLAKTQVPPEERPPKPRPLPMKEAPLPEKPVITRIDSDGNGVPKYGKELTPTPPEPPPLEEEYTSAEIDQEIIQTVVFKKKSMPVEPSESHHPAPKPEPKTGLHIFLGDGETPETSVFGTITANKYRSRSFKGFGIGEIKISQFVLPPGYLLNLVAVPTFGKFNLVLDNYANQLTSYSLVVDCLTPERWEYLGYLARMLHEQYSAPFFLIAVNVKRSELTSLDILRDRMGLDTTLPIYQGEPLTKDNIVKILKKHIHDWPEGQSIKIIEEKFETVD